MILYDFFKSEEWQALVPRWNIYYMAKEGIKQTAEMNRQFALLKEIQEKGDRNFALMQDYRIQLQKATAQHD
jgi:hypothetical protein